MLKIIRDKNKNNRDEIARLVKDKFPDYKMTGLAVTQILRFTYEIKRGDIVIIPDFSTHQVAFGEVTDDEPHHYSFNKYYDKIELTWNKARSVTWRKRINKLSLNPKLYSLFWSQQAISSGDEYAEYIDSTYYNVYKKRGKLHLQIGIRKDKDLNARDLFRGCLTLLDYSDEFLQELKLSENTSDIDVKITVNSPGYIELIGYSFYAILVVGIIVISISGGELKAKFKEYTVEVKTGGIFQSVSRFLRELHRQETLTDALDRIKAEDPKDLEEIIKKLIEHDEE